MKNFKKILPFVLLIVLTVDCFAQNNHPSKTALFDALPKTINCTSVDLNKFFSIAPNQQTIHTSVSDQLNIDGAILSNTFRYKRLHSIVIRLSGYNDAIFSISKRMDENNLAIFMGHIIHQNSTDGYELKKTGDNLYQFIKASAEAMRPTCAQGL